MLIRGSLLALATLAVLTPGARTLMAADAYPSRVVTMIVPYAAGGPTDTVARLINEPMTRSLGQQVVVENVGGASGTIGAARAGQSHFRFGRGLWRGMRPSMRPA